MFPDCGRNWRESRNSNRSSLSPLVSMAGSTNRFPWREKKDNSIMKADGERNDLGRDANWRRTVFAHSASKDLVDAILDNVVCSCGKPFSYSEDNKKDHPILAPCGHYKHNRDDCLRTLKHKCSASCMQLNKSRSPSGGAEPLKGFLAMMHEPGYSCCKCGEYHPLSNSVRVLKDDKTEGIYICVWCAMKDDTPKYKLQFIDPIEDKPSVTNTRLKSLDRCHAGKKDKYASVFVQCCTCGSPLSKATTRYHAELLSCNHFRHVPETEKDAKLICEKRSHCNMCIEILPIAKKGGKLVRMNDYINYVEEYARVGSTEGRECKECEERHPSANLTWGNNYCYWCAVEKKYFSSE